MGSDLKICCGFGVAVAALAAGSALYGVRINTTPSHPMGIYRIVDEQPAVGHYAMFCVPVALKDLPKIDPAAPPICTKDQSGRKLLKRIVAVDHQADTVLAKGDHPDSIDSRHFGAMPLSDVKAVLNALWVAS